MTLVGIAGSCVDRTLRIYWHDVAAEVRNNIATLSSWSANRRLFHLLFSPCRDLCSSVSVAERRWLAMIQRIRNAAMRKRFSSALCRRACRYCPGLNDTCAARNDTCAAHNDWPLTFSRENSRGWGVQRGKVWNHTVSSRMRVANTCLAFENRQFRRAIFPCNWQGAGCNSGCLAS